MSDQDDRGAGWIKSTAAVDDEESTSEGFPETEVSVVMHVMGSDPGVDLWTRMHETERFFGESNPHILLLIWKALKGIFTRLAWIPGIPSVILYERTIHIS